MSSKYQSLLFSLPQELRLAIYEYALESPDHTKIGTYAVNNRHLADWPIQTGLVRTCSLLREEALPLYFSRTNFHVTLQSQSGMQQALAWIKTNSQSCPWAFNHLRHIKFIVGSGVYGRPEEFVLDLELRDIVSCRTQSPQRTLMFGENICGHPGFYYLTYQLARLPDRRSEGFDLGAWLETVVQFLYGEFTVGDACGFML